MLNELEYSEGTVRSATNGVSEQTCHTCEIAQWDQKTLTVITDVVTADGDNYVKESAAVMVDHREDMEQGAN